MRHNQNLIRCQHLHRRIVLIYFNVPQPHNVARQYRLDTQERDRNRPACQCITRHHLILPVPEAQHQNRTLHCAATFTALATGFVEIFDGRMED